MESLRTGTAVAEKRGCSRWEYGETIEKGSICHDERVAYRPFCCIRDCVPADLKSAVKKVRPIKTGGFVIPQQKGKQTPLLRIANPQNLNRLGHFLTPDCKSGGTPSGKNLRHPIDRTGLNL